MTQAQRKQFEARLKEREAQLRTKQERDMAQAAASYAEVAARLVDAQLRADEWGATAAAAAQARAAEAAAALAAFDEATSRQQVGRTSPLPPLHSPGTLAPSCAMPEVEHSAKYLPFCRMSSIMASYVTGFCVRLWPRTSSSASCRRCRRPTRRSCNSWRRHTRRCWRTGRRHSTRSRPCSAARWRPSAPSC